MPDTLTRRDETALLSDHELIRRERRPLPAHDLDGANYRAWALAVCHAEVEHRSNDFEHACFKLRVEYDRWANPNVVMIGSFDHEGFAGLALTWLSHLQFMDGQRRGVWASGAWGIYTRAEKVAWVQKRRTVVHGFLRAMAQYRAARAELDRQTIPVLTMREAA